ncbi:MAG: Flp pilus assembly protein CpaB [Acidimicrobiales bacterium]
MHIRPFRSPLLFWTAASVVALLTGLAAARFVGEARAQAVRYGGMSPVVVAVSRVERGAVVDEPAVALRLVPASLVPPGALSRIGQAVGRTVAVPLLPGVPVVADNLAPDGLRGLSALLPPATRAVAVPRDDASVKLQKGDLVDVLAILDVGVSGAGEPTVVLAEAAPVLDVAAQSATIAVAPDAAADLAYALAQGVVTLAVTAPPPAPARPAQPEPGRPRTG